MGYEKKMEDQVAELRARVEELESLIKKHEHNYSELTGKIPQHPHKTDLDEIYRYINKRFGREIGRGR